MTTNQSRDFNCKDEELPVICDFASKSLTRDLADFMAYSPKFDRTYVSNFNSKIMEVDEMVSPKSERAERKKITERLYTSMNGLINPLNHLAGYVEMAYPTIKLTTADFGISDLRKGINSKDAENVIGNLKIVLKNIDKYIEPLTEQGLNTTLVDRFKELNVSIAADKSLHHQMLMNRKAIVQSNLGMLNDLFVQLTEILKTGKILYKANNPVKLQEYTFNELKKGVRRITKKDEGNGNGTTDTTPEPTA
jgi:hypothetical protein